MSLVTLGGIGVGLMAVKQLIQHCFATTEYYTTFQDLRVVLGYIKPGDLLEIDRTHYSHYALYLGNKKVLNVCAEDKSETKAHIKRQSAFEVCGESKVRIRNHDDVASSYFKKSSRPPAEILREAMRFENTIVPYEFLVRNCEYYCTLWRFGVGFSTQVAEPTEGSLFKLAIEAAVVPITIATMVVESAMREEAYFKYKNLSLENGRDLERRGMFYDDLMFVTKMGKVN